MQDKNTRRKVGNMNEQWENLLIGLADAGCTGEDIKRAERFIKTGSFEELNKHLRRCRAALLDDMHKSQKRVDRMDYLIRQAEKISAK